MGYGQTGKRLKTLRNKNPANNLTAREELRVRKEKRRLQGIKNHPNAIATRAKSMLGLDATDA
jgi:hypothetical protein